MMMISRSQLAHLLLDSLPPVADDIRSAMWERTQQAGDVAADLIPPADFTGANDQSEPLDELRPADDSELSEDDRDYRFSEGGERPIDWPIDPVPDNGQATTDTWPESTESGTETCPGPGTGSW